MRAYIDVVGRSGAVYRYDNRTEGPLSPMAGNYVFIKDGRRGYEIVYAGEANNLASDTAAPWRDAQANLGATDLFARLNVAGRTRREELADVLAAHHPVGNPDREPAEGGAEGDGQPA